tara:strand:- start:1236 stop:1670 length:435 start_codon:yes stop_codon:yes gene_type:complete
MFIPCDDYPTKEKRIYLLLFSLFICFGMICALLFSKTNYKDFLIGTFVAASAFMSAFLSIVPNILALQLIHYSFTSLTFMTIFTDSFGIILVSFLTVVILQMLWYKFGSCMMFREGESWGMEMPQNISARLWTIILGYKLFHRF